MAKRRPHKKTHAKPNAAPAKAKAPPTTETYEHKKETVLLRPDVGTQAQFKKQKPAQRYRYDSSLSPALEWDGQNAAREQGETLIAEILALADKLKAANSDEERDAATAAVQEAARGLKALGKPFLDWAGKAERLSFDVPTLPLFVHERLSTEAIIQTLRGHRRGGVEQGMLDFFADPQHSIADQVLKAYEYRDQWTNRMILGDSLVVMNSLLRYEGLGGQVQMIYMDPPYGIKYGSNFQPFVRRRDVKHNDDDDLTREPEMVQAYRDTWEIGLHSYLTCMRDRLLLCRDLLAPSGSVFVQISDENLHHVREVMDEVFGPENSISVIPFRKKTMPLGAKHLESVTDYLVWFARDIERTKFHNLYERMSVEGDSHWNFLELADGTRRKLSKEEINNHKLLPAGSTPIQLVSLYPAGVNQTGLFTFKFRGKDYRPPQGNSWFTHPEGMQRLADEKRIEPYEDGETLRYVLKLSDSPITTLTNLWSDTSAPSDKTYVVQTSNKVLQRCLLMTTDPGDLVLDPTCGSGTTAYVAEQWGRRWITADVSRVPMALARQRLLTATFAWYDLKDEERGPAGGFVYKRKQNKKGEEVGGIMPYISKGSIANNEPPVEEVLVDRPEENHKITRVTGPFTFEAMIPTAADLNAAADQTPTPAETQSEGNRMLEVLRRSPVLRLDGNRTVTLHNLRPPAKSLSLSAEAVVDATAAGTPTLAEAMQEAREQSENMLALSRKPVALVFGPENAAVSEKLVNQAAKEASAKNFTHLFVIGFAIQPHARQLVDQCESVVGIPATYVQATPDLLMGDLLKNMRSSQIFSVCGLPEVAVRKRKKDEGKYEVELLGLDVFDPTTMETQHRNGNDVPAWFLDTDYNDLCFHVCQAFFPRTSAWDNLKKALKGDYSESVWDHLAGTISAPFEAGDHQQIAVKVIDDRGNELVVVKSLQEAEKGK